MQTTGVEEMGMTNEQFETFCRTLQLLLSKAESVEEVQELLEQTLQIWIPKKTKSKDEAGE
jgi:hypothetical protein